MSCAQPFKIQNPHFNERGYYQFWKRYIEVPCGWCLNCRLDKQNWLSDAMNYEQKKYNYIGAFVTFTYDDIHILDLLNTTPDDYFYNLDTKKVEPLNIDRDLVYSLRREDSRNFLKRLRRRIDYLYSKNGIKNVDLCRRDFKFCCAGEYGDCFGRPHYHFVFFGLDWQFCKDLFEECWQNGIIDSKPIQSGCFEYITKYLIKQVHGMQAKEMYDDKKIERPFFTHSLGLGKGLILDQYDFIKKHNLCYLTINDTLRPIPIYYRNHFFHKRPLLDYSLTENNMIASCIPSDRDNSIGGPRYSIKKMNDFRHKQSLLRHRQLEKQCENKGIPVEPLLDYFNKSHNINIKNVLDIAYSESVKNKELVIPRNSDGSVNWPLFLYGKQYFINKGYTVLNDGEIIPF